MRVEERSPRRPSQVPSFWIIPATIGLIAFGGLFKGAGASDTIPPPRRARLAGSASILYDTKGNPIQAFLTLQGLPAKAAYRLCVDVVPETKPSYNRFDYGVACKTFTSALAGTTTQAWGTNFPWGGPAEYRASWSLLPAGEPISTATFAWTWKGSQDFSPCPPDPYLMQGVWQPARFTIENRCYRWKGEVRRNHSVAPDGDWGWQIRYRGNQLLQVEFMPRDKGRLRPPCSFDCSMPSVGEVWEITGVFVCDRNHQHRELHPVFEARQFSGNSVRRTLLSGPQYSTQMWAGPYPTFDQGPCP